MNKTLLLFIVDFLFLNLIALTRWERAEPARERQPPVNAISANAVSRDQDLVEAMRQSLADEQLARQGLEQKLQSSDSTLAARERSLGQLQADSQKLTAQLVDTQRARADLGIKYEAVTQENSLTRSQLAELQRQLEDKKAEAERQKQALVSLEKQQQDARKQIEGLMRVGGLERAGEAGSGVEGLRARGPGPGRADGEGQGGAGHQRAGARGGPVGRELGRAHERDPG
jgi:hypothetical protein